MRLFNYIIFATAATIAVADADNKEFLSDEDFASRMEIAGAILNNGDYESALAEFEKLRDAALFEIPNYEPFFFIAGTNFLLDDLEEAQFHLDQFKCMLRVDSGIKKCSNASDYKTSTPDNIIKFESDFSNLEQCYQTMCSALYHTYYDDPTKETLLKIAKYWSEVDELQKAITARTSVTTPIQSTE